MKRCFHLFQTMAIVLALASCSGGAGSSSSSSSSQSGNDGKIAITSLFQSTASVTASSKGVTISSPDEPYEGRINGVFYGDFSLQFEFPETPSDWYDGDFKIYVRDALDPDKGFIVRYKTTNTWEVTDEDYGEVLYAYTGAYVLYNDQSYSSYAYAKGGAPWYKNEYKYWGDMADCSPIFKNANPEKYRVPGVLQFVWEENGLNVKVNCRSYAPRTIAAFDGTDEFVEGESWGLPEMDFKNGYTVFFSSSFENPFTQKRSSDVLFESVTYFDSRSGSPQTLRLNAERVFAPGFFVE